MTTIAQARELIYDHFIAQWGARTKYTFDNEQFTPVKGVAWARLSVRHTGATPESFGSLGNRRFERFGIVLIQVFVPAATGRKALDDHADFLKTMFEGKNLSGIRLAALVPRESAPEALWEGIVCEVPFAYSEVR